MANNIKIGGKITINSLKKQSASKIKNVITKIANVSGRNRNTIKNIDKALKLIPNLGDLLVGKTIPQIFNSSSVGIITSLLR